MDNQRPKCSRGKDGDRSGDRRSVCIEGLMKVEKAAKSPQQNCLEKAASYLRRPKDDQISFQYRSTRNADPRESNNRENKVLATKWDSVTKISDVFQREKKSRVQDRRKLMEEMRKTSLNLQNYRALFSNQTLIYLFLGFLLDLGRARELLFALLVEFFRSKKVKKTTKAKDSLILGHHIFSLFIHVESPLHIANLSQFCGSISNEINDAEDGNLSKSIFDASFEENIESLANHFLLFTETQNDIHDKYLSGDSELCNSAEDFDLVIGRNLQKISRFFQLPTEFNPEKTEEIGLVVALQTLFSFDNLKSFAAASVVPEIYFTEKKNSSKGLKSRDTMGFKHTLTQISLVRETPCFVCKKLIWGKLPQALECLDCSVKIHPFCSSALATGCFKRKNYTRGNHKRKSRNSSSTKILPKPDQFKNILLEEIIADQFSWDSDLDYQSELPSLEGRLGSAIYKAMPPNSRKFHQVANEFIHTERSHLRILKIMNFVFNQPMRRKFSKIANTIFPSIDELIECHSWLVLSFKEREKNKIFDEKMSQILILLFNDSAGEGFLRHCVEFCSDQKYILNMLNQSLKSNPDFAAFVGECENSRLCRGLNLKDLLISQMQRLARYPLLIDQMIKYLKDNQEESERLNHVKRVAKSFLDRVNSQAAICENRHFLENLLPCIEMKYDTSIIPPYNTFDVQNKILLHTGEGTIKVNKKYSDCLLLLFDTDLVILFKTDNNHYTLRSFTEKASLMAPEQSVSPITHLSRDIVIRILASDKKCFLILNQKKLQLTHIYVSDGNTAKTWVNKINAAVEERIVKGEAHNKLAVNKEKQGGGELNRENQLKKVKSFRERTSILMADKNNNFMPHMSELIKGFNAILGNMESNYCKFENNKKCIYVSVDQIPQIEKIVDSLEIMSRNNFSCSEGESKPIPPVCSTPAQERPDLAKEEAKGDKRLKSFDEPAHFDRNNFDFPKSSWGKITSCDLLENDQVGDNGKVDNPAIGSENTRDAKAKN